MLMVEVDSIGKAQMRNHRIKWPTSQNTLHIPLPDFMKLPCETPEALITTLKMQMRLHGIDLDGMDEIIISIDFDHNVVRVEATWSVPF